MELTKKEKLFFRLFYEHWFLYMKEETNESLDGALLYFSKQRETLEVKAINQAIKDLKRIRGLK